MSPLLSHVQTLRNISENISGRQRVCLEASGFDQEENKGQLLCIQAFHVLEIEFENVRHAGGASGKHFSSELEGRSSYN